MISLLGLQGLVLLGVAGCVPTARAGEITATTGAQGLGTIVNDGTTCTSGLCAVTGGTVAGPNLFHRFNTFDTRGGAITGVSIDNTTSGASNVFVGVLSPTFINQPVGLTSLGSLTWLSPAGISIQGAGGFTNVTNLNLSTATGARIGNGVFDAVTTTPAQAAALNGTPVHGRTGLVSDPQSLAALAPGLTTNGNLTIAGGLLTVDRDLLLDAQGGHLLLQNADIRTAAGAVAINGQQVVLDRSAVDTSNLQGAGGNITLTGDAIGLLASRVSANGTTRGGQVLVGGDERGLNPAIPNASQLYVDGASSIRADGIGSGDGGKIVLYSRLYTQADGNLSARGGSTGGNGGFVETSGGYLGVTKAPDVSAPNGIGGQWLIDPWDIQIVNSPASPPAATLVSSGSSLSIAFDPSALSPSPPAGNTTYLDVNLITNAFSAGASLVTISTSESVLLNQAQPTGTPPPTGIISLNAPLTVSPGQGNSIVLSLQADDNVVFNFPISNSGLGTLSVNLERPPGSSLTTPPKLLWRQNVTVDGKININSGLLNITGPNGSGAGGFYGNQLSATDLLITAPTATNWAIGAGSVVTIGNSSSPLVSLAIPSGFQLDLSGNLYANTLNFFNNGTISFGGSNAGLSVGTAGTPTGIFNNSSTGNLAISSSSSQNPIFTSATVVATQFNNNGQLSFEAQGSSSDILNIQGLSGYGPLVFQTGSFVQLVDFGSPGTLISPVSLIYAGSISGTTSLTNTYTPNVAPSLSGQTFQAVVVSSSSPSSPSSFSSPSSLSSPSSPSSPSSYSPFSTTTTDQVVTALSILQQPILQPATGTTTESSSTSTISTTTSPLAPSGATPTTSATSASSLSNSLDQSILTATAASPDSSSGSTTTSTTASSEKEEAIRKVKESGASQATTAINNVNSASIAPGAFGSEAPAAAGRSGGSPVASPAVAVESNPLSKDSINQSNQASDAKVQRVNQALTGSSTPVATTSMSEIQTAFQQETRPASQATRP